MTVNNVFYNPSVRDEEEEDWADDDMSYGKGPRRYFPDEYLDSPILLTHRTRWLMAAISEPDDKVKDRMFLNTYRDVKRLLPDWKEYRIIDPEEYPSIYRHDWPSTITDELEDGWAVAHTIRQAASTAFLDKTGCRLSEPPRSLSSEAQSWFGRWSYFDSVVSEFARVCSSTGPNVVKISLGSHSTIVATKDVWFHHYSPPGQSSVKRMWTYDQWLMVKDVLFTRAQVSVATQVFYSDKIGLPRLVNRLYEWHESCLLRHNNAGYEILKSSEALSKTFLSELTDPYFTDDGPYIRMLAKVRSKEQKLREDHHAGLPYLSDEFDGWIRSTNDIQSVVEIFGLLKVSGHPLIDPALGGRSAASEARTPDPSLFHHAEKLDWEFKRTVLQQYVAKEGHWPSNLQFSEAGKKTRLMKMYRRQVRDLTRNSYPLSDWKHCRFGQIVEFDYSPNYLDLIDDKSISLYRSNARAFWDRDVRPISQRRLLIELINRHDLNIREIVNTVVERRVPFDWLIVSLHPKEREFKLDPRMFSMLVLEIRIFFALTEANIADKIFPYIPQQTMTKSKNEIGRQFLDLTRPSRDHEALRLFLEIDLSRWNLRWRQLAIGMIGRTLNDMFGVVGIFDYVHEFFSSAMILVRVPGLRPDGIELDLPPESDILWYNHLGGFEGIAQKVWSIPTYMTMSLSLSDLPLSYILQGQADNQIASLLIAREPDVSPRDTLYRYRDVVTELIKDRFAEVNQEVKPEECIESTSVITYSKDVYVNGVYRPTTLKFHSRLYPHSSQTFPSVRTNVGAIFSTAMAGAEKSIDPTMSHFLACFHSGVYMSRISKGRGCFGKQMVRIKSSLKTNWRNFIEMCLTLPSECGGFPILPLVGFSYKGGSDPLGKSVSNMVLMGLKGDSRVQSRMLRQIQDDSVYNPKPKLETLFLDPFSAPFRKPPTSVDGVASETIRALSGRVKIEHIASLMRQDTRKYLSSLSEVLSQCRPLNPLIIRDILDCSIAGVADTVSRMFVATRTLQDVVRQMKIPIVDRVLYLEAKGLIYMYDRYMSLPNDLPFPVTAYELTTKMRERWFPGEESPIVGLTTYQPLDFDVAWGHGSLTREGISATLVATDDPSETRGPYDPYIGSKTREKRSEHGYKIVGTDTASIAMRKLQLIASQTGKDESFVKILDVVGWSRTNTQLSEVSDLLPGMTGGISSHRYASRAGHQGAYNMGSPNFATHCVVSSDNTGYLSGGAKDYAIMFQEFILFSIWLCQLRWNMTKSMNCSVSLITEGTQLDPLPSVTILGPDKFTLPVLRFPDNPLTFIQDLSLERVAGAISHPAVPIVDHIVGDMDLVRHALEDFFRSVLRKQSAGRQIADGAYRHDLVDSLDIAEIISVGVDRVARAIAFVAADEAISNYMMTHSIRRERWRPRVVVLKLVEAMTHTVTPLLGHPLVLGDPVVRSYYLYDGPTYLGGTYASHNRFNGYVAHLAMTCLSGDSPVYRQRSRGIFVSSTTRTSPELMLTSYLTDFYLWEEDGVIDTKFVRKTIGQGLIPVLRKSKDDTDRVQHLVRSILTSAAILRKEGLNDCARALKMLASGRRLKAYQVTTKDILKAIRDKQAWGLVRPVGKKPDKVVWTDRDLKPRQFSDLHWESTISGVRRLPASNTDPKALLGMLYDRNVGRTFEAAGTSLYYWEPYAKLFPINKPLLVVGSGPGAVARVALDRGVDSVYGLDLRSSLPMKAHRFVSYKPPLVQSSEYADRYHQAAESFMTTGDWMDPDISRRFLLYDSGQSTVVIDIQRGEDRFGLETLGPVLRWKTAGLVIIRLYLSLQESIEIMSDLQASDITAEMYDDGSPGVIARLIVLRSWRRKLAVALTARGTSVANPVISASAYSHLHNNRHLAISKSDALFNVIQVGTAESGESYVERIADLLEYSLGDYESRFNYDRWTILLRSMVVAGWMQHAHPEARDRLLEMSDKETLSVLIGGKTFEVRNDSRLMRHIATLGARTLQL